MLVIMKDDGSSWTIRSFKRTHTGYRDYRCYIDVCHKKKTLTLHNCSETVKKGVKKIFRTSKIKDGLSMSRDMIKLSDKQMYYVDVVLAGARWSTVLRHYMEVEKRKC